MHYDSLLPYGFAFLILLGHVYIAQKLMWIVLHDFMWQAPCASQRIIVGPLACVAHALAGI